MQHASTAVRRIASVAVALALTLSLTPVQPAAAAGCSISGRMVDAKTGAPVGGRIFLYKLLTHSNPVGGSGVSWQAVARTDTWSGNWTISKYTLSDLPEIIDSAPNLPPGTYRVAFVPRGSDYIPEVYDNVMDNDLWAGKNVVVHGGEAVTGIDAALSDGWGYVGGTVTDELGAPLGGVEVTVEYWSTSLRDWNVWTATESAANGTFKTGRLPEGIYRVRYLDLSGRHALSFYPGTALEDDAAQITVDENLTTNCSVALQRRSVLNGRVRDSITGEGISDVSVTAFRYDAGRDSWAWDASGFSAADGSYSLRVNGAGEYRLEFRDWSGSYKVIADDRVTYYPLAPTIGDATSIACASNTTVGSLDSTIAAASSARFARALGSSIYARSAALSAQTFTTATASAVLVNPANRGAVAAAPALAATVSGPVLYTAAGSMTSLVASELVRLGTRRVYVVGPVSSVGTAVVDQLRLAGISVVRVTGSDSAGTTAAVLRKVKALSGTRFSRRVIVVNASRPTDIGAATALAYRLRAPIVLTSKYSASTAVARAMRDTGVRSAVLVGTSSNLSSTLVRRLSAARVSSVRRSGATPAATAASVSAYALSKRWATYATVGTAGSMNSDISDMTLAGCFAGRRRGVLLFATANSVPAETSRALTAHRSAVTRMRVMAPPTRVSTPCLARLSNAIY